MIVLDKEITIAKEEYSEALKLYKKQTDKRHSRIYEIDSPARSKMNLALRDYERDPSSENDLAYRSARAFVTSCEIETKEVEREWKILGDDFTAKRIKYDALLDLKKNADLLSSLEIDVASLVSE